jgi:hypothetical protein
MSTIQNLKTIKEFLLELYRDNLNQLKTPKIKDILSKRKHTFIKEYLKMNNISISSTCSVKTESVYKTGHLIIKNNKMVIHQYESNKTEQNNELNNSIIETIDIYNPIFFIDFNMVTCELVIHKKKQKFRLIILGKNMKENDYENDNDNDYIYKYRVVKFKMPYQSKEVFNLICENINKSIILSTGYKYNIFGINIRNNFCKEYFINHKKFVSVGNTGDILLFKGHSTESQLQRLITSDDYDHVGILIKNKDGLNVYESTGSDGVKLRPWHEFITYYWYLLYDVMAFRKLKVDIEAMKQYITGQNDNIKMNDIIDNDKIKEMFYYHFNKNVEKFIEQTENKKYVFSKIGYFCTTKMKKNSIIRKSYSCSELIAALYYYIGIITDAYEARNYLPGHFAKKGTLPFKKGFSLSEEYIIDFSSSFFIQN